MIKTIPMLKADYLKVIAAQKELDKKYVAYLEKYVQQRKKYVNQLSEIHNLLKQRLNKTNKGE